MQRLGLLLAGLFQNNENFVYHGVGDQIHQKRRTPILPAMGAAVKLLNEHRACNGAFISGAGPAVAALTRGEGRKIGELGVAEFARWKIDAEYRVLSPDYLGLTFD